MNYAVRRTISNTPNEDTGVNPFRPDYDLVCSRFGAWLFLHNPALKQKLLQ